MERNQMESWNGRWVIRGLQSSYVWLNGIQGEGVAVSVYSRAFHHAFHLIDAFGVCDCKTIMRCVCVLVCLLVSIFVVRFNT